ncbi:MAG: hypothetical protein Q4A06_02325 [Cardiobacteriaceae bacterium]|nr:hypothetical protein [Cardiobacteriaceae bacterium]
MPGIWCVAADGSNCDAIMDDFAAAFAQQALPFWTRMGSAANAAAARQYQAEKRAQTEKCLRYWLRDACDYAVHRDAHGGESLRTTQGGKP